MSFSSPSHAPSTHASAKHNRSGPTHPRPRRHRDAYPSSDDDSEDTSSGGDDDLDRALAKIQACNARLAQVAGGIPFPTAASAHHHTHHARAPRDLPAQKPMPPAGAPLPLPPAPSTPPRRTTTTTTRSPVDRNKPLPPSPRAPSRCSFNSASSYVGSEETNAPSLTPDSELARLRWAQYSAMIASARASTDSLAGGPMRSSPTLMYKGSANSFESHYSRGRERDANGLPLPAEPKSMKKSATRTFGEFLKTAKNAGARVRKTSLDAYHAASDKAWELRVAAKYARKDVQKAAGTLTRTVSRELMRGSGELRRVVSLSSRP